jgi:polyisoprenoid-binding protein YceI
MCPLVAGTAGEEVDGMARSPRTLALLIVALGCGVGLASPEPAAAEVVHGRASVSFVGRSTLHDFEGQASPIEFSLEPSADGRWAATVELAVASLDTGNDSRDAKMRDMFEAERFPNIVAEFDVDPERVRPVDDTPGSLPFVLRIRDVERPIEGAVTSWQETETSASFDVSFPVSLDAYGLEAPSALFFIRVGDTVDVHVHVELERQ